MGHKISGGFDESNSFEFEVVFAVVVEKTRRELPVAALGAFRVLVLVAASLPLAVAVAVSLARAMSSASQMRHAKDSHFTSFHHLRLTKLPHRILQLSLNLSPIS